MLDNRQGRARISQPGRWRSVVANVIEEVLELQRPGLISPRIFPRGRFRRAHLRKHLVVGQSLQAVASSEPLDLQLASGPVDLQREQVLPFCAADVKKRRLLSSRPK